MRLLVLHFYCLPSSTITTFLLSSLLHHYISIVFPNPSLHFHCLPSSITSFPLSSLLHHYISIIIPPPSLHFHCHRSSITTFPLSSLLHHYISIVIAPPSLHFHCLPSSSITAFLLSSLLHHHYISIVFRPSPLPFCTTTVWQYNRLFTTTINGDLKFCYCWAVKQGQGFFLIGWKLPHIPEKQNWRMVFS